MPMVGRPFGRIAAATGRLSLTAKGVIVVAIPVAALLAALTVFYLFQRQTTDAQGWVEHTFEVRAGIRDAMLQLANAETGLNGYLLTGRPSDLNTYRAAREQLGQPIANLEKLIRDNPAQAERVKRVQALESKVVAGMESQHQAAATGETVTDAESQRANVKALRTELAAMQAEEDLLLQQRTTTLRSAQRRLQMVEVAGGILGLLGGL